MKGSTPSDLVIRGALHPMRDDALHAPKGDLRALAALAIANDRVTWGRLLGLMILEPNVSPLALVTACMLMDDPPPLLRERARAAAVAALHMMGAAECASLRQELGHALRERPDLIDRAIDILATPDVVRDDRACRTLICMDDVLLLRLWMRLIANNASDDRHDVRMQFIAALSHAPRAAAIAGGTFWGALSQEEQTKLAHAAADDPMSAADLSALIGAGGWLGAPTSARQAILSAIKRTPWSAKHGGIAIWKALSQSEREEIAFAAAQNMSCAADILEAVGEEICTTWSPPARAVLLRAATASPWVAVRAAAAAWMRMDGEERRAIASVAAQNPSSAADLMESIGHAGWRIASHPDRSALMNAALAKPGAAARGFGAVWQGMDDEERAAYVRAAATNPAIAVGLMRRIDASAWQSASKAIRSELTDIMASNAEIAACVGVKAWHAMSDDERILIAESAASHPFSAADLMKKIGAEGWETTPVAARAALANAVAHDPHAALSGGAAVWTSLDHDVRLHIAETVAHDPSMVATLITRIGNAGWQASSDAIRATLLHSLTKSPMHAAIGGGKIWAALSDSERCALANAAAAVPSSVADLMKKIGAEGWETTPVAARAALVNAVARDPHAAMHGVVVIWSSMDAEEMRTIVEAAASDAMAAAHLLINIGVEALACASDTLRGLLISAACQLPFHPRKVADSLREGLTDGECAILIQSALRSSDELADLVEALGVDRWLSLPESARATAFEGLTRSPESAARGGGAIWAGLSASEQAIVAQIAACNAESATHIVMCIGGERWDMAPPEARESLLRAVLRSPDAAALALPVIGERLEECQLRALAYAALGGAAASQSIAQALNVGAPWRDWMTAFLPGSESDDEVLEAWRDALAQRSPEFAVRVCARLPVTIALRLLSPRSVFRR